MTVLDLHNHLGRLIRDGQVQPPDAKVFRAEACCGVVCAFDSVIVVTQTHLDHRRDWDGYASPGDIVLE